MIDALEVAAAFRRHYKTEPRLFRAPGRVNLIGEHTDYNDGYVLPIAIDRDTVVAASARNDRLLQILSLNLDQSREVNLDRIGPGRTGDWIDYVAGIAAALSARGIRLRGASMALKSDIGIGSGLSSSAALEVSLGKALLSLAEASIDNLSLALAGQTAEHQHVGIQCGIMDQFASVHALANHAMLLDCRSHEARQIPLDLRDCRIVICDSRVKHTLASSEYNQRRRDCQAGVKLLSSVLPEIQALRDVGMNDLESNRALLNDTVYRRCRHVVRENARTLKAAEALSQGNIAEFGRLMSESHRSLRDDYEVSCRELDLLVECAMSQPDVLGARMTGGGFGGCTVNLVREDRVESFRENVAREYQARTKITPEIFAVEAAAGAREFK